MCFELCVLFEAISMIPSGLLSAELRLIEEVRVLLLGSAHITYWYS